MYVFQEFPKWKYHAKKGSVIVGSKEAEAALGSGWLDTPASFCDPECEAKHGCDDSVVAPIEPPAKKQKRVKS